MKVLGWKKALFKLSLSYEGTVDCTMLATKFSFIVWIIYSYNWLYKAGTNKIQPRVTYHWFKRTIVSLLQIFGS